MSEHSHILALHTWLRTADNVVNPPSACTLAATDESGWTASLVRERGEHSSHSTTSLDHAVSALLKEAGLGAGTKGRLPRELVQIVSWLQAGHQRELAIQFDAEIAPAQDWEPDADQDDDVWLTRVNLRAASLNIEAMAPSYEEAVLACRSHRSWKKIRA